jgi:hypothetical protein
MKLPKGQPGQVRFLNIQVFQRKRRSLTDCSCQQASGAGGTSDGG